MIKLLYIPVPYLILLVFFLIFLIDYLFFHASLTIYLGHKFVQIVYVITNFIDKYI